MGTITGFAKDPSGAVIPAAKVSLVNEATGVERQSITNQEGYFVFPNLQPAMYTLRVEAPGFKRFETSHIKLDPNSTRAVEASLAVGQATETVEVVASAAVLQSESATVQKLISREQIDALELNGRNPIFLAQLQPGVRRGSSLADFGFGLSSGGFSINGSRSQDNLITFDGAPAIRTRSNGTSIGVADVDSTQEIQVLTSNYSAEYGRSSGGQIRIITKSGTRDFHGNFYEYFRHDALNANSWNRNTSAATGFVSPFRYNQYGYNLSGPVWFPGIPFNKDRNRLFWFWGQEWVKYHYLETTFQTVPTMAMRNGDFSELLTPNALYRSGIQLRDPNSGAPIPGNIIPANLRSSNGLALLNAYPAPNVASGFVQGNRNWTGTGNHTQDQRKDTLAIDIMVTDNHRVQGRRQSYSFLEYQPLDGNSDRVPKYFDRPNQTNSVNWVWTISPRLVHEAQATFSLDNVYIPIDLNHNRFDRSQYGINYPYIFPTGKEVPSRIPTVNLSGPFLELNGGPYPSHSSGPIYTFSDTLSWVRGNHTFKFGFSFEYSGQNDFDQINVSGVPGGTNNQNGRFAFSDSRSGAPTSGLGIANAAMGLFDVYSEIGPRSYTLYRGKMFEGFAQDSWKATQKLHLDYGVRYTVIVPYDALWRNMAVFDSSFYDPSKAVQLDPRTGYVIPGSGDRYNGLVIPGEGIPSYVNGRVEAFKTDQYNSLFRDLPSYYSKIHYNQWQPRLGIAYQVTPKTVVRSGVGRFFTRLGVSDSVFLGGNPPFQPIVSVSNGVVDNPGGGSQNLFPLTVTTQSRDFKNPEAWAWNFTVERELPWNSTITLGYVGRRGLHQQQERDLNQLAPGTVNGPSARTENPNFLRPYKGYAAIRQTDNVGTSIYNSLQINWNRRFANGFSFGAAYTLSKLMDDGSAQRDIIPNTNDRASMWGPAGYDTRHVLIVNYIYELPFLRGNTSLAGRLLGGWQISGVTQAQTGYPVTIGLGNDYAGVGSTSLGNLDSNPSNRSIQFWNINGDPKLLKGFATSSADANQWFATRNPDGSAIFTAPAPGTFATGKVRNRVYGPGFQNWNVGLFKRFAINERAGFQFRAEAFNFVNHPNLDIGRLDIVPTSGTFGKVTGKNSERNLQLSLRFSF